MINKNLSKTLMPFFAAAVLAALSACGDEITEVTQIVGMQLVEEGDALPKCTKDNEGALVYSMDSAAAYYCVNRKWTTMKGKDGKDGADGKDGKNGVDGKNGKDGNDGKNGKNGENGKDGSDGKSCTVVAIDNGYKIVCGEDSVGVLLNGEDGAKGDPGVKGDSGATGNNGLSAYEIAKAGGYTGTEEEWIASLKGDPGVAGTSCSAEKNTDGIKISCTDGKSFTLSNGDDGKDGKNCEIVSDLNGVITLKCGDDTTTLYKAMCGTKAYDPAKTFCDTRDNKLYKYVAIGSQIWMAENLNYKVDSSFCYNDSVVYCEKYGRLYTWTTAVGKSEDECGYGKTCGLSGMVRGVCPEGWHLPDTTELNKLISTVGGRRNATQMLKSQTGWNGNDNGTDAYGFSALPAGKRFSTGDFVRVYTYFWSSTEDNYAGVYQNAYNMTLFYDNNTLVRVELTDKYDAYSVRCLKD